MIMIAKYRSTSPRTRTITYSFQFQLLASKFVVESIRLLSHEMSPQFNLDGSVAWRFATNGEIWGSAKTTRDGSVVFGSMDKFLYCLNDTDGTLFWNYSAEQEIAGTPLIQVPFCASWFASLLSITISLQ